MSMTIALVKENLTGMLHGGTLNKVRNQEVMFERAANVFLSNIQPLETIRLAALSNTIHDDIYNYSLPSDFRTLLDFYPQDNREASDVSQRRLAEHFDLNKAIKEKTISIEGSNASKIIRINWRSRAGKTIHTMNSLTDNGTWSAVASATGLVANSIFKVSGSASIEFDIVASGDGIQNITMTAVDLTDHDEVGDFFTWMYFGTVPTSISARWGNDLTTNYWSSVAQTTQADGTAFKIGWNLIKFPWSTATETGTVAPATIDSFRVTVASSAQNNVRVDNIICSIGRNFDIKYGSKFLFQTSSGTWITKPTSDDDVVVLDSDSIQMFLLECVIAAAQQMEGEDSGFDIGWANKKLHGDASAYNSIERIGLYAQYRAEHPDQTKKAVSSYGGNPARGRW